MTEKVKIESFNKGKKVVSRPYLRSIETLAINSLQTRRRTFPSFNEKGRGCCLKIRIYFDLSFWNVILNVHRVMKVDETKS